MSSTATKCIPWEEFHRDARALCKQLAEQRSWSGILAVARGGLFPAAIIARELDIRVIQTLCVKSYEGDTAAGPATHQSTVQFLNPIPPGDGSNWLVVDDLSDSGATIQAIRAHLPKACYAAVYTKPKGRVSLNYFEQEFAQNCWLNFPWDLQPTYAPPLVEGNSTLSQTLF